MAKLILATVFCFFLLVKGTEAQAIGADCTDTCTDSTATCDTTCKIKAGETCPADSTDCIANAACGGDPLQCTCGADYTVNGDSTQCEAKVGISCDANTPCVSGSTCDTTCKVNAGESCAGGLTCVTSATCDGTTCKANAGEGCDANTPCVSTATCDGTCKVNLGESCAGSPTCVTDATCTSDSVCKKEVTTAGEACPTLTTFCTSTTLTCNGGLCKVPAGQSCAATLATQCTAHADCSTTGDNPNICTCSTTDGFRSNAGVCEGTKDKDATCANDNCKPGLVCDGGKCKVAITEAGEDCSASVTDKACDTTTLACQNDKCKLKIEQVCTDTDQCVTGAKCEGSLTTKQCNCPMGVQPSSDKAQCGGAMGIAASMLLVVATFLTSRFL